MVIVVSLVLVLGEGNVGRFLDRVFVRVVRGVSVKRSLRGARISSSLDRRSFFVVDRDRCRF